MKLKDIARDYNLDQNAFRAYLEEQGVAVKAALTGAYLPDEVDVAGLVQQFQDEVAAQVALEEAREQGIANVLVTTGEQFDGYRVTSYGGPIAGDFGNVIPRGVEGGHGDQALADAGQNLVDTMEEGRNRILDHLRAQAYDLGCNAIIGLTFDYVNLMPETVNRAGGTSYLPYVFIVTAVGTAVVIEEA